MNNLFNAMQGNPFGNIQNMMNQIQNLKKQFSGRNPQDIINQMIQSGQITNEQVQQAQKTAEQFRSMMNR